MKKRNFKIHYVFARIPRHSLHSGYDRLTYYIDGSITLPNFVYHLLNLLPEKMLAQMRRKAGKWYNSSALKQEIQIMVHSILTSNNIYHFLYGEDAFRYCGSSFFKKKNKIVVTYHLPPGKFDAIISDKSILQKIDAIIVVSTPQVEHLAQWVSREKIYFIHHGVDVNFFTPPPFLRKSDKRKCLFVGTHLRDFECLTKVILYVSQCAEDVTFVLVSNRSELGVLSEMSNVYVLEDISEEWLLACYRDSDLLLLPLVDSTANNTLLEAMACGLPVVTNEVGGVRDYLNDRCAMMVAPGDARSMAEQVLWLLENDLVRSRMSIAARERALEFDWRMIAQRMQSMYESLFQEIG